MTRAETQFTTPQASLYLQQLCKHWSHKFPVEFTPQKGMIPFPSGAVCLMEAEDGVLKVAVETPSADDLVRFEGVVIEHLKRFAHREDLGEPVWRAV